jgi:hypothetical protein
MSICGSAGPEIRTFQSNLSHVIRSRREVGGSHPRDGMRVVCRSDRMGFLLLGAWVSLWHELTVWR